jgi:hypothetical protein
MKQRRRDAGGEFKVRKLICTQQGLIVAISCKSYRNAGGTAPSPLGYSGNELRAEGEVYPANRCDAIGMRYHQVVSGGSSQLTEASCHETSNALEFYGLFPPSGIVTVRFVITVVGFAVVRHRESARGCHAERHASFSAQLRSVFANKRLTR